MAYPDDLMADKTDKLFTAYLRYIKNYSLACGVLECSLV